MSHPGYLPDCHVNIHAAEIFSDEQSSVGGGISLQSTERHG